MRKLGFGNAVWAAAACLLMTACGGPDSLSGDGGDDGGSGGSSGGTSPTAANIVLLASSPQLSSSSSDASSGVTLTAILKDSSNNVVPGVTVKFATADSALISVANPAVSDSNGRVEATLTTGGDPQNRTITVQATAGTGSSAISASVPVQVVGTTLGISGPANTQSTVDTTYTALLTDSAGSAIVGATVTATSEAGNTVTIVNPSTDSSGQVTIKLRATQADSSLSVSALGLTATKDIVVSTDSFRILAPAANSEVNIGVNRTISVEWLQNGSPVADGTPINFSVTRGSLSATTANTVSGVASVSVSSPQAGLSTVVASSDALTKPSASVQLEFVATTPDSIEIQASPAVVATNESSEISVVVLDSNFNLVKNATIEFSLSDATSGNISSPTAVTNSQGLARITFTASSRSGGTRSVNVTGKVRGTSIQDSALLTVGGRAVGITIGTGAEIGVKDTSTYQLPFTVLVTDSNGNPVPDADFSLGVLSIAYRKGVRTSFSVECPNEDVDRNGILTGSEDTNSNGQIDPGFVASVPTTIELDEDGAGQFNLTYPKDFGQFVKVRIVGVATVAGTDTTETREFWLDIAQTDAPNLDPNSPYGASALCNEFDPQ